MASLPTSGCYGCVDIPGSNLRDRVMGSAIRMFTHSAYDHAFVVLDADAGVILQADPSGSRLGKLSDYDGMAMVFSEDAVMGGNVAHLTEKAARFTGIPYGYLDIVYLGLSLGAGWRPPWLLHQVLRQDRMICSQLVAAFGVACGARSWQCGQADAQLVTPGMLGERALREI